MNLHPKGAFPRPVRPRVLTVLPALIPSTMIAVVKPLLGLHQMGRLRLDVELEASVPSRVIGLADLIVFCRNCEPRFRGPLDTVTSVGKPYVYVLDDDLLDLPLTSEVAAYHHNPRIRQQLQEYLAGARLVTVFSWTLARKVRAFNPRVEIVSGSVDLRLLTAPRPKAASEPVRIVYATGRRRDELAELFVSALLGILGSQGSKVEAHIWGGRIPELANHPKVRTVDFIPDYDRFLRRFSGCGFDIGLAPLLDDDFHRSKTNNKYREYGACRIAGIYSDVDVYTNCVQHEANGLIVRNTPEAWHEAMLRLIEDAPLRERIRDDAFRDVRQNYSLDSAQETWWRQIEGVLAESDSSPRSVGAFERLAAGPTVGPRPLGTAAARAGSSGHPMARLRGRLASLTRLTPARAWNGLYRRWFQQYALCKIKLAITPKGHARLRGPRE